MMPQFRYAKARKDDSMFVVVLVVRYPGGSVGGCSWKNVSSGDDYLVTSLVFLVV